MEPTVTVRTQDMMAEVTTDTSHEEVVVYVTMPGGSLTLCGCHCRQLLDLLTQVQQALQEPSE